MIAVKQFAKILFLLPLIFLSTGASADLFDDIMNAAQESEDKRLLNAPNIAPKIIPEANNQSMLGSYLVEQLTAEGDKRKRQSLNTIKRDLRKLNTGITGWEAGDYSSNLEKSLEKFKKHTQKYKNMLAPRLAEINAQMEVERARLAAEETEKQARLAAEEAERQKKQDAYLDRCEGGASDDPFAVFDTGNNTEDRIKLRIDDSYGILLAANKDSCLWNIEINRNNEETTLPTLLPEDSFQQNPNNKLQYLLNIENDKLILDFANQQCILQVGSSKKVIACVDPDSSKESNQAAKATNTSSTSTTQSSSISRPSPSISCRKLLDDFEANEMKALSLHKGKTYLLSGTVGSVQAGMGDKPVVKLSSGEMFDIKSCYAYPASGSEFYYDLNKNQKVTMRCEVDGEMGGSPVLRRCVLAN